MPPLPPTVLEEDLTLLVPPADTHARDHAALWAHWPAWAALGVAVLVGYFALRRWGGGRASAARREDPAAVALRELAPWANFSDEARYREAVAAISATVRRYVEDRFGLRAPRLTTEEFWEELRSAQASPGPRPIPAEFDPFFEAFMGECDEIKYAGYAPDGPQFHRLLQSATEFVRAADRSAKTGQKRLRAGAGPEASNAEAP